MKDRVRSHVSQTNKQQQQGGKECALWQNPFGTRTVMNVHGWKDSRRTTFALPETGRSGGQKSPGFGRSAAVKRMSTGSRVMPGKNGR